MGIIPWSWQGFRPQLNRGLWTPRYILDLKLWLRADPANITLTGTNVVRWADLSGKGNHATQIDGTNCPQFSASVGGLGNRSAVSFSGNDWLEADGVAASLTGSDIPYTVFIVTDVSGGAVGTLWSVGRVANTTPHIYSYNNGAASNRGQMSKRGNDNTTVGMSLINTHNDPTIRVDAFDGVNCTIYSGTLGTENSVPTVVGAMEVNMFSLGMLRYGASRIAPLNGNIAEVIVYNRALTDAEINLVANHIKAWYSLAWTDLN